MHFKKLIAASLAVAAVFLSVVPPALAKAQVPWLYENSDVPPDPDWTFGELDNGVRYAVRPNGVPPGQVSILIRVDAGSLNERDGEEGYAHLLEHLLFRQSKYLADGAAIPTWQRLGASFGSDTNAETTPTQTVYKLDLPNATQASLDETFKLLSGMVTGPTLNEANIAADVPIVLAEMRERGGAAKRVQEAMRESFYEGQPLAERSPIGTTESLRAANAQSVRAFYSRWYRPANVVVVAAGGDSPAPLEALIRKWFSGWRVNGAPVPAPSFGDPVRPAGVNPANPVGGVKVMVEPDLPRGVTYAVLRPWRKVNDTIAYNQGLMTDALAQAIITRRLESRARAGGSYLVAQVAQEDVSRSVDATFVTVTPLTEDWQAALRDVRAVIADALAHPPSVEEIARETAELDVAFQVPVEQQRLLPGSKFADDLVNALDIRETVAAPADVLRIFRSSVPLFTPEAVQRHSRQLFSGEVIRALYVTPRAGEANEAQLRGAMLAEARPDPQARPVFTPIAFDQLPLIGKPGRVENFGQIGVLEIAKLELANGVKAMLWPVKEEPGRVTVKVRFGKGYGDFSPESAPYITLGEMALVGAGVATLGQEELDRIATGRKLGFDFEVKDATFEFSAETRPADLADQLYLFAAKLGLPRWDENPVQRARAAARLQYETFATSPQGVLSRDLDFFQRGRDRRYLTPTPAQIDATTPAGFRQVWEPILSRGPVEVQIFGDFDTVEAVSALQRTFGALPSRQPVSGPPANPPVRGGEASAETILLSHRGDAEQAAAVVSWPTGGGSLAVSESRQLEILSQLFTNRLIDGVREKLGVSYSPYVYSTWPVELQSGGAITAVAQVGPKDVPLFFEMAEQIAADLVARPASNDELDRVLEPLRQQITRAASSSGFFMQELEGATRDPSRIAAIRTILPDYTQTTPQAMQALAAKYLGKGKNWRLAVLPEQQAGGEMMAK
jgi:zinc protease